MRKSALFKLVAPYIAAVAVIILTALLLAAIYFSEFSPSWIAFLSGVLAAAILSMVSHASKAEWIIARRDAKISLLHEKLAVTIKQCHELELKFADIQRTEGAETLHAQLPTAVNSDPSTVAQEMFVQSVSEQMAGSNDGVKRILFAIENNEFRLYCQRISSLRTGTTHSDHFEILIRLIEEEEGMMPPGGFFPLVEKYGLMPQLDRWVVQHMIEWLSSRSIAKPAHADSVFFINLSSASIADNQFPIFVRDKLKEHNMAGRALCFEVSETELIHSRDQVMSFAKAIQGYGCAVAISNFGRSNVSFEPLFKVRANFLKIDGSVILDLLRDPADLAQAIAIAKVAKIIDVQTIAEMVESDACIAKLREIGIDFAQGFGVSIPAPLDSLS